MTRAARCTSSCIGKIHACGKPSMTLRRSALVGSQRSTIRHHQDSSSSLDSSRLTGRQTRTHGTTSFRRLSTRTHSSSTRCPRTITKLFNNYTRWRCSSRMVRMTLVVFLDNSERLQRFFLLKDYRYLSHTHHSHGLYSQQNFPVWYILEFVY